MRSLLHIALLLLLAATAAADRPGHTRRALRALAQTAATGDPAAIYRLAMLHDTGYDSIPVDSARSTALYRLAAMKGYPPAQNYLGFRYFKGEYVEQDLDSAMFWLRKAADAGDAGAANNLGFLYLHGECVERDDSAALRWLSKAAEAGLHAAESQLADMYRLGLATAPDTLKAEELYVRAIDGGVADAELKLLTMKSRSWETLTPDSAVTLGLRHYNGRSPSIATTLFSVAAIKGSARAMALLGDACSKGRGAPYDHDAALEYFLRGALEGDPSAAFVIAELLDIFPDALTAAPLSRMLDDHASRQDATAAGPGAGLPSLSELQTPAYWYGKAAAAGITDADTAASRLLSSP